MNKKRWLLFVIMELVLIFISFVSMKWLGFYTIEVELWRKILATIVLSVILSPIVWAIGK